MNLIRLHGFDLISEGVKVLGFIVAVLTVILQLRKQHQNSLALQRENAREALKLRIYETLVKRIRALSDANTEAKMYAFGIIPSVESVVREHAAGNRRAAMGQRACIFRELHYKAERELAELIEEFECWSIAFPGLQVFKIALNSAAYDVRQAFPPLFEALLPILPMDPPPPQTGTTIIHPPPSRETFAKLRLLIEKYKEAMDEIGCYVYDLTIEAQNNLLHGLFDGKVPPRRPLDPRHKVLSTSPDKAEALTRYFENESPWGKNLAEINAWVKADVLAKTTGQ